MLPTPPISIVAHFPKGMVRCQRQKSVGLARKMNLFISQKEKFSVSRRLVEAPNPNHTHTNTPVRLMDSSTNGLRIYNSHHTSSRHFEFQESRRSVSDWARQAREIINHTHNYIHICRHAHWLFPLSPQATREVFLTRKQCLTWVLGEFFFFLAYL